MTLSQALNFWNIWDCVVYVIFLVTVNIKFWNNDKKNRATIN